VRDVRGLREQVGEHGATGTAPARVDAATRRSRSDADAGPARAVWPWTRLLARLVDGTLLLALVLAVALAFPAILDAGLFRLYAGILVAWILLEAAALGALGTTPGKLLLGLRVTDRHGTRPGFGTSLARSALVQVFGCGLGIPIIALFQLIVAYREVASGEPTYWDRHCGTAVVRADAHG
jgi:uncharacterized RDD family membrane protein YckC